MHGHIRFFRQLGSSLGFLGLGSCGGVEVPAEGLPDLIRAVEANPALYESALDGCVQVHHLWKSQIRVVHRTADQSVRARVRMLVDSVQEPYTSFWSGYMSSGFRRWARTELDLAGDPRAAVPMQVDLLGLITDVTASIERATGRRGCAEWYLVFGPGWTNLGGLGSGEMLIDFLGLPSEGGVEEIRRWLPHEIAHITHDQRKGDDDRGTLLSTIISEGFASYFTDRYWGDSMTPAEAIAYSEDEWRWAVQHEQELWTQASEQLSTRNSDAILPYRSRSARARPDAPAAVGYFLGYRIAEAYVARNGSDSYYEIFELPVAVVLERSGYLDAGREQPNPGLNLTRTNGRSRMRDERLGRAG